MPVQRAQRALTPLTRESTRESGEIVREFDVRSAATVLGAFIGAVFLVFFLAAFLPWLLANGMTAAVEGMMHQVGFNDFRAETLGDWILVLFIGAVFTAFIVAIAVAILALYNVLSQRTGMGLRMVSELPPADEAPAVLEVPSPQKRSRSNNTSPTKRSSSASKSSSTKRTGTTSRRS